MVSDGVGRGRLGLYPRGRKPWQHRHWQIIAKGNIREMLAKGRRKFIRNPHHSICHYVRIQPAEYNVDDPLKKRKFCAQDIFDVETTITGFGSSKWEKTHEKATKTATVLEILKQGGATCIGKTIMDELGFSLIGTNRWLGTPKNPFSAFRICGGASSGAAVSVGSNAVDFAILKCAALKYGYSG